MSSVRKQSWSNKWDEVTVLHRRLAKDDGSIPDMDTFVQSDDNNSESNHSGDEHIADSQFDVELVESGRKNDKDYEDYQRAFALLQEYSRYKKGETSIAAKIKRAIHLDSKTYGNEVCEVLYSFDVDGSALSKNVTTMLCELKKRIGDITNKAGDLSAIVSVIESKTEKEGCYQSCIAKNSRAVSGTNSKK